MTAKKRNIGSEWAKWDLHVHSPSSDGFVGDWMQFECQLANASCNVIGINDYFSVDGYKEIKKRINNQKLDINGKNLLPVVEFRMTERLQNRQNSALVSLNFHVIFSDDIGIDKIENYIKSIVVDRERIGSKYDNKKFLKEKAKVSLENTIRELNNDRSFRDKFLIWLPYNEYGGVDGIEGDDWAKKNFIEEAHILGSSNEKQIRFFLWESDNPDQTSEKFKEWFSVKKPCIKGSDSHRHNYPLGKLQDKDSEPIDKFCWIKAEPTFEGLKQIVFEPKHRVYIGEGKPSHSPNVINTINLIVPEKAKVNGKRFCFAGVNKELHLSPYFNCFIGGRGSGKSTILNFLGIRSNYTDASRGFWEHMSVQGFNVEDDNIFSFEGIESFEFLGQNQIESFAKNNKQFTQAIYNRANAQSGEELKQHEENIENLQREIFDVIQAIEHHKRLEGKLKEQEKDKRNVQKSLEVLNNPKYQQVVEDITKQAKEAQKLTKWHNSMREFYGSLKELHEKFSNNRDCLENEFDNSQDFLNIYNSSLVKVLEALSILEQTKNLNLDSKKQELSNAIKAKEKSLEAALQKVGLSKENIEQVKKSPQKLKDIESQIQSLTKNLEENRQFIDNYLKLKKELVGAKGNYERKLHDVLMPLQKILKDQFDKNKGQDIKEISLKYNFNEEAAWKEAADEIYLYFREVYDIGARQPEVNEYICKNRDKFSGDDLSNLIETLLKNTGSTAYLKFLRSVFEKKENWQIFIAIRDKHLFDVKKYKSIQVSYDGSSIEQASFGQQCTAVLVILLLFGNYPLIIDEPEAHLDSSLIANYLVPLIKEKKADRQLIFATHNANFVVNGDAEKIFILNNDTGITNITETTIENLNHRDKLLTLEGGVEAFMKRGEKFNIKCSVL